MTHNEHLDKAQQYALAADKAYDRSYRANSRYAVTADESEMVACRELAFMHAAIAQALR